MDFEILLTYQYIDLIIEDENSNWILTLDLIRDGDTPKENWYNLKVLQIRKLQSIYEMPQHWTAVQSSVMYSSAQLGGALAVITLDYERLLIYPGY